jgi:hypothetical protein
MPAPKTSVDKTVQATEPQFLGTSCLQHTGSTIMTDAVDLICQMRHWSEAYHTSLKANMDSANKVPPEAHVRSGPAADAVLIP